MAIPLPEELRSILDDIAIAHVATVGPDGHPQNTAMWIMRDGDHIILNTSEGRVKWHNMRRDPRVGVSISTLGEDEINFSVKGRVVEMRTSDGFEVIDTLAHKYLGVDRYPWLSESEVRVTIVVEALGVTRSA